MEERRVRRVLRERVLSGSNPLSRRLSTEDQPSAVDGRAEDDDDDAVDVAVILAFMSANTDSSILRSSFIKFAHLFLSGLVPPDDLSKSDSSVDRARGFRK